MRFNSKKPFDPSQISDATILAETSAPVNAVNAMNSTSATSAAKPASADPETLKPLDGQPQTGKGRAASPEVTLQSRMQQAAAAAVLGAAHKAINNAFQPRPNWAFARQSSAHLIALGFGSGLMRPAPGTWGTVFGWVTFNYLLASLTSYTQGLIIVAAFVIGVWACGKAGKALGVIDHGAWVWDEVVAFWLVLWLLPSGAAGAVGASFTLQAWAFAVFRFFDIVKPPPIRQWDAQLKSGFGVMWDDIVAAFYTLLVVALWLRVMG